MATEKYPIARKLNLVQQEAKLHNLELETIAKVTAYTESSSATTPDGLPANEAVLEDVPINQQPGPLHLEQADDKTQADKIIADQKEAGKSVAFGPATAYVESTKKIVIGFR